jgi:SMODS and SLOG-associating 2TM effector domain 1
MTDEAAELLHLYSRYRIQDQVAYYARQADRFERALRRAVAIAALLFVAATMCGALASANAWGARGMWAFCSAGFAALATALSAYEVAFGFERYSRRYAETLASLKLVDASRPADADAKTVVCHVTLVETLLRSDVESWSQLYANEIADQTTADSPARPVAP